MFAFLLCTDFLVFLEVGCIVLEYHGFDGSFTVRGICLYLKFRFWCQTQVSREQSWGNFSILEFIIWITAVLGDAYLLFFSFSERTWNLNIVELIFKACFILIFVSFTFTHIIPNSFCCSYPEIFGSNILTLYAVLITTQVLHLHSLSMPLLCFLRGAYLKVLMARDSIIQFWLPWYTLINFAHITQSACLFSAWAIGYGIRFAQTWFLVVFVVGSIRSYF